MSRRPVDLLDLLGLCMVLAILFGVAIGWLLYEGVS